MSIKRIVTALSLGFILCNAFAGSFDKVIVFGDSLSDNGNLYRVSSHLAWFPTAPTAEYYKNQDGSVTGRFTNGRVFTEDLARDLGLDPDDATQFDDYAYGGAWTEPVNHYSKQYFPKNLVMQVNSYIDTDASLVDVTKPDHLYVIWMGANDYFGVLNDSTITFDEAVADDITTQVVNTIISQMKRLIETSIIPGRGAQNFVIMNLPDLGETPYAKAYQQEIPLTELSRMHNIKLRAGVDMLRLKYPTVHIAYIDVYADFKALLKDHLFNGHEVANVEDPCYTGGYTGTGNEVAVTDEPSAKLHAMLLANPQIQQATDSPAVALEPPVVCENPDDHLYWDHMHPTAKVHEYLAEEVMSVLGNRLN